MSLDTYANLKAEIIDYSGRDDVSAKVATFISVADSRLYSNPDAPLRIRQMETTTTGVLSTSVNTLALPTGFEELRTFKITVGDYSYPLTQQVPNVFCLRPSTGIPHYFTTTDQIELDIISDTAYAYEMKHYSRITALSDANPTNAVLTNYPDIYLFGGLWQLYRYSSEEQKAQDNYQNFIDAIAGANRSSAAGRYGPAPRARVAGSKP